MVLVIYSEISFSVGTAIVEYLRVMTSRRINLKLERD